MLSAEKPKKQGPGKRSAICFFYHTYIPSTFIRKHLRIPGRVNDRSTFPPPPSTQSVAKQQSPNGPMPTTHPPTDPPTERYGFFEMRARDWASSLIYTEWQRHHREGKFSNHKPIKAPSSHFRLRSFEQTEPHKSANNCNLIII